MRLLLRSPLGLAILALTVVSAAGCDDDNPNQPTDDTIVEVFASTVHRNGSATRAFQAAESGTIELALIAIGAATDTQLGIGIGTGGTGGAACTYTTTATVTIVASSADPQLTATIAAGSHCVGVFDVGQLGGATSFSLRISRPRED